MAGTSASGATASALAANGQAAAAVQPPGISTEAFLQLLGRAVRQLRAYAPTHALCVDAVAACHRGLVARSGADELVVRVSTGVLQVNDQSGVTTTVSEPVLVTQLLRARVAELTIGRDASVRDLSKFGIELLAAGDTGTSLTERLTEQGITSIAVRLMPRPELLDVPAPDTAHRGLLAREHLRRQEMLSKITSTIHLYPPDKGWVRVDPTVEHRTLSLTDLAILVDHPAELADVLARLADEEPGDDADGRSPVERRFGDIARIFAALEPRLGRVLFARLARVVLAMQPDARRRLLRETVLPGLLDGEAEAAILHDFPDPTLAETLCLLMDLETAAPDVVSTALDRLGLPAERRRAVEPLIDAHVQSRRTDSEAGAASANLDWYARRLTRIEGAAGVSFTDYAAFDLAFDTRTGDELAGVQEAIGSTDTVAVRLACVTNLVRVEPNPEVVAVLLQSLIAGFGELRQMSRWTDLADQAARLRALAAGLRERRPDVADVVDAALVAFCTRDVAYALLEMHHSGAAGRADATAVIDAVAGALAPALLALLDEPLPAALMDALTGFMSERGAAYAPALMACLAAPSGASTAIRIVKVLGHAGAGCEDRIAAQLQSADEALAREALRALARIGTPRAGRHIATQLTDRPEWLRAAALESMLRLPSDVARAHLRGVLARRDLACRHPALMRALLDRTARGGNDGLKDVLGSVARLRFRFWQPAVVRLGRRAQALLAS